MEMRGRVEQKVKMSSARVQAGRAAQKTTSLPAMPRWGVARWLLPIGLLSACALSGTQPVGFEARVDVAKRMLLSGQHDSAYRLLDDVAATEDGNTPKAQLAVGDAYFESGAFLRAETAYRAAIANGAIAAGEVGLGRVALGRNAPDSAISHFNAALKQDSENLDAINGLGVALDLKGLHAQARAQYIRILKVDAVHVAALNNMAMSNVLSGSAEIATITLRDLAESNLSDATLRQNLALALHATGRSNEATKLAEADLDGPTTQALFNAVMRYRSIIP
jgi:Flp pilus assembly protein TadD